MLKFYFDNVLNKFFPGVKGVGLIIILPTCLVVIIYFLENLTDIKTTLVEDKVVKLEKRYAFIKEDLPSKAVVNYVTNQDDQELVFTIVDYVFVPIRIIRGLKPQQDYLIVDYLNKTQPPKFKYYSLKKRYRNGVILFERNN
jgi:hypothetical protein